MSHRKKVRVEELIGRKVRTVDGGHIAGRIEEIRAEQRGGSYEVTSYLLGPGALLQRLGILNRLRGLRPALRVVRWDQLEIERGPSLRLNCRLDELTTE
jgi:hypothetical protein